MSNFLCIDFDFFFPEGNPFTKEGATFYDWGHKESPFMIEAIWPARAMGFLANDMELPQTTGEEDGFWDRFAYSPNARLYVAESNAFAINPQITDYLTEEIDNRIDSVWLYDAHHDCGYREDEKVNEVLDKGTFSCENWMYWYAAKGAQLNIRYPAWKDWAFEAEDKHNLPEDIVDRQWDAPGTEPDVAFDAVFLCRSGAWVPPWCDPAFFRFLADAPFGNWVDLMADDYPIRDRGFDLNEAVEMSKILRHTSASVSNAHKE